MVHAELSYNPYLLETEVLFNGEPPRINSLVEKYQGQKLQEWIAKIPSIFYNEMNGYDFELNFNGTALDFEELKKAFLQAGVGNDLVQLFHKNELESRNQKVIAIDELIDWLKKNPNRTFDADSFLSANKVLFEGAYSIVTIGGNIQSATVFDDIDVAIDNVESVDELRSADLKSTLIILYLDHKTVPTLHYNLAGLLKRPDVEQNQLFFWVSPALGDKIIRVIHDLGMESPQIVDSVTDAKIHRYLEIYPVTEYIYDSIKVFRKETDRLSFDLAIANKQSEIANNDIHYKIRELENTLNRLKTAYNKFCNKNNLEVPSDLVSAREQLIDAINQWRIKKVKISKIDEAEELSKELQTEVLTLCSDYYRSVSQIHDNECERIVSLFDDIYQDAKYKTEYVPDCQKPTYDCEKQIPVFTERLMVTKEEQYVVPKEDFFGIGKLFKGNQDNTPPEPVLETTFYLEKWREIAVEILKPILDKITDEVYDSALKYYNELAGLYAEHTNSLIENVTKEKEEISAHLSEDEQLLQADNDWLSTFCDRLHNIERA